MAETNATILIPDISGYTEFMTTTELKHSSLAINIFLDIIIQAVGDAYEVSEIEGDAVLLIRKGPAPTKQDILNTCLKIFNAFHFQRVWFHQHTICPCRACIEIKHLAIKFVAHHGPVAEIKVGRTIKQTGTEMIVAHRLLKNKIDSNEYLLMTEKLWNQSADADEITDLNWNRSSEEYPSLGKVEYRYALLDEVRKKAPVPPKPESDYPVDETPFREVTIDCHYKDVFMILKNIPDWAMWVPELQSVKQDFHEAFLGSIHHCTFEGYTSVISPIRMSISDDTIHYAETCRLEELGIAVIHEYVCQKTADDGTRFSFRLLNAGDAPLPAEMATKLLDKQTHLVNKLKEYCEKMEESFF